MARRTDWLRPGEHAIVTGGSSGIGLALAAELAARGAVVSLLARGRALARWGGVLAPVLRRYMDGKVRKAQRAGAAVPATAAD